MKIKMNEIKKLTGALKKSIFTHFTPELAYLSDKVPDSDEWLHEIKFDGYRIVTIIKNGKPRFITRNNNDWTHYFPKLGKAIKNFPFKNAILDGELVAVDDKGISNFQLLQNSIQTDSDARRESKLKYFIFDLPYCQDFDLTQTPLIERKDLLKRIFLAWKPKEMVMYSDFVQGHGLEIYNMACQTSLEGIISKKAFSPYEQRRSKAWLKNKCNKSQEFVIGGFTDPKHSRKHFGSLLLGYYNSSGNLIYCGHVGTGFSQKSLAEIYHKLTKLEQNTCPFYELPIKGKLKHVHWLKPKLICEVKFSEWTEEGIIRHPSFEGLRMDKKAKSIVKESTMLSKTSNTSSSAKAPNKTAKLVKLTKTIKSPNNSSKQVKPKNTEALVIEGIEITHPNRIIAPMKITKGELARYYAAISDKILPYIENRPLLIMRCPKEGGSSCFFQKHLTKAFPKEIVGIEVGDSNTTEGDRKYLMIKNIKGLISLIQFNVVEIHPWGSQAKNLEKPDRIVFDLDPAPGISWRDFIHRTLILKKELDNLKLKSFIKTTGGKGFHITIPINPLLDWTTIKNFTRDFAIKMSKKYPDFFVSTMSKKVRTNKIFIDYLRNARNATSVAAFSTRVHPGAPISTPLSWKEVNNTRSSREYNINNIRKRINKIDKNKSDPWKGFYQCKQKITQKMIKSVNA